MCFDFARVPVPGSVVPPPISIADMCRLFNEHCVQYYKRRDGSQSREAANIASVLLRFQKFAQPENPAASIQRHVVRSWLMSMADEQLSRSYVNGALRKLRACINWSADVELIPMSVQAELRLVKSLAPLRSQASEHVPRAARALAEIDKLSTELPAWARAVLQLQKLTGARPSEILELTNSEIHLDPKGSWVQKQQHKSAHKGKTRRIPLCDSAVAIVDRLYAPFCPDDLLFRSPRSKSGCYSIEGYRAALSRAAARSKVARVLPYDVRRAVAVQVRAEVGLDAAQALLGHSNRSTTEIYAPVSGASCESSRLASLAVGVLQ